MQFNKYLKQCRKENNLTQEQLVHNLYIHDIESFDALDTGNLGKWERGITKPKAEKQVSIIKYFQKQTGIALPCWDKYTIEETESLICKAGMNNLIGKSKKHIYNFPSATMQADDISIYPLRNSAKMDELIDLNMPLHQDFNHAILQLTKEQFKEWLLHPSSLFLACEYKGSFIGLLFTVKLKVEVFDKVLNFKMKKSEITTNDFAVYNEMGSSFFLSFFAVNQKVATLLFIRYYAYLIANQKYIFDIGGIASSEEAIKVIENMNLQYYNHYVTTDNVKIKGYRQTLSNTLASKYVVKMLLSKQECPEE